MNYLQAKHFADAFGEKGVRRFAEIINRKGSQLEDLEKEFPHYSRSQLCRFRKMLFVKSYVPVPELLDCVNEFNHKHVAEQRENDKVFRAPIFDMKAAL